MTVVGARFGRLSFLWPFTSQTREEQVGQQPQPARPRRRVHYKLAGDALGPYIILTTNEVLLPEGMPAHKLPSNTQLQRVRMEWRFLPGGTMGAHELRQLFLEFAEHMGWDVRLDP